MQIFQEGCCGCLDIWTKNQISKNAQDLTLYFATCSFIQDSGQSKHTAAL